MVQTEMTEKSVFLPPPRLPGSSLNPDVALQRARDLVAAAIPGSVSLAEELIADRRREAALERNED
jgi:hypothetical protein